MSDHPPTKVNLWTMEIESLRFFCCLYDIIGTGHITAGAALEKLQERGFATLLGSKSVTNKVQKLEAALGGKLLFQRDRASGFKGRTELAESLERPIREVVNRLVAVTGAGLAASGEVTIAVSPTILEYLLPPVLKPSLAKLAEGSGTVVRIVETGEGTSKDLEEGRTQLAITWEGSELRPAQRVGHELIPDGGTFPFVVVVPAGHRLYRARDRGAPPVTPEDLSGETVLYPDHPPLREAVAEVRGSHPINFVEVTTTSVVLAGVRHGTLLGIAPAIPWVLDQYEQRSELTWRPPDDRLGLPAAVVKVYWRRSQDRDEPGTTGSVRHGCGPAADLVEQFKEHLRALPRPHHWDDFFVTTPMTTAMFEAVCRWHVYYVSCSSLSQRGPEWFEGLLTLQVAPGAPHELRVPAPSRRKGDSASAFRPPAKTGSTVVATLLRAGVSGQFLDYPEKGQEATPYEVRGTLVERVSGVTGGPPDALFFEFRGEPALWSQSRDGSTRFGTQKGDLPGPPGSTDLRRYSADPFVAAFSVAVKLRAGGEADGRRVPRYQPSVCLIGNWTSRDGRGRATSGVMLLRPEGFPLSPLQKSILADHCILRFLPNALTHAELDLPNERT